MLAIALLLAATTRRRDEPGCGVKLTLGNPTEITFQNAPMIAVVEFSTVREVGTLGDVTISTCCAKWPRTSDRDAGAIVIIPAGGTSARRRTARH